MLAATSSSTPSRANAAVLRPFERRYRLREREDAPASGGALFGSCVPVA